MQAVENVVGESLLTADQVARVLSVSLRKLWRMKAAGELPSPVKVGVKGTRWRSSDLERFIRELQ